MRSIILSIILVFLLASSVSAKPDDFTALGTKGCDLAWNMEFDKADKIIGKMIKKEPENALGYLLRAHNYLILYFFAKKDEAHFNKYEEAAFKAVDVAEKMLEKNSDDVNALFYIGSAYGYLGYCNADKQNYYKALKYARKGVDYSKEAVEKDPEYYDAYMVLGIYRYIVGALPKSIRGVVSFLLDIKGDKEKGLKEMLTAKSKGRYVHGEAGYLLASQVYMGDKKDYKAAQNIFEEMIIKYPNNGNFKVQLSECYFNLMRADLSVPLLEAGLKSESLDRYPLLHTRLYFTLGKAYSYLNLNDQAIAAFNKTVELSQYDKIESLWTWYAWANFFLGKSYEMKGSTDKALEYYSKVKKKDDGFAYKAAHERMEGMKKP